MAKTTAKSAKKVADNKVAEHGKANLTAPSNKKSVLLVAVAVTGLVTLASISGKASPTKFPIIGPSIASSTISSAVLGDSAPASETEGNSESVETPAHAVLISSSAPQKVAAQTTITNPPAAVTTETATSSPPLTPAPEPQGDVPEQDNPPIRPRHPHPDRPSLTIDLSEITTNVQSILEATL